MTRRKHTMAHRVGLPPGSLTFTGRHHSTEVKMTVLDYSEDDAREKEVAAVAEMVGYRSGPSTTWINISGLHNVDIIGDLGKNFGIHPLVLEDIVDTSQRPKLEDYGDYLYIVLRTFDLAEGELSGEQVSLIVGDGFVISFQESDHDLFRPVRERINNCKGRIRREGADYLAYALIDTIVDNYFVLLETLGERLEDLEDELVTRVGSQALTEIHRLKREMLFFRKALWPLREVIGALGRGESAIIKQSTLLYIRDVYDHTIQVIDTLETYRDILAGLLDIYLSSVSNRLNQVMKVLTVISTIFMPLTFIVGLYGMNFEYMPELKWQWGYPAVLVFMASLTAGLIIFFRRKQWL
jgi:magnesium transporter